METEITDPMFELQEPVVFNNSVEAKQYKSFIPQTKADFNRISSTIEIDIPASDTYYKIADSYIHIKGKLVRADNGTRYAADAQIALINNAVMYLFTSIQYSMGGKVMETLGFPGQTTSMLGYLNYPDDFNTSTGLKQCWNKDTTANAISTKYQASPAVAANAAIDAGHFTPQENPEYNQGFATRRLFLMNNNDNSRGDFSFIIPFAHIFGFSEYEKVLYNVAHNLKFSRASDDLAIYRNNGCAAGKVELIEIKWIVPKIVPSTQSRMQLLKLVNSKTIIPLHFSGRNDQHTTVPANNRSFDWNMNKSAGIEKPRWIIVGFQTNKINNQEQNPAVFDHVNLSGASVSLNGDKYPTDDVEIDFSTNDYARFYEMADNFKREYYGINNLIGGTQINFSSFKSLFPIIVFDVRNQSEQVRTNVMSIQLNFTFREDVPANTHAYAVIISDRLFRLSSDGQNTTVITY